jgi:uncharacterized protein
LRVVLDTNVLVSTLFSQASSTARIVGLWRDRRRFDLLTAQVQIDELMRVSRYPKIRDRISPTTTGRLIKELRGLAIMVTNLPIITASPDAYDNYLLSIAVGGQANCLVTGDKTDLLSLKKHQGVAIVSVGDFLARIDRNPS